MKRRRQQLPTDAGAGLQIKVWLIGISPMVWRRVLVPAAFTPRELHGVIQVAIRWDGFHLFQFGLRAVRYGSSELAASSPDVTLAAVRLRNGARFVYDYDLNIPWRHGVRIEGQLAPEAGKTYAICAAGNGACAPEDCGGPDSFVAQRDDILSLDSRDDLATMAVDGLALDYPHLGKFVRAAHEFAVYIRSNTASLINYGERYRAGERISSCLAESSVNAVISKRFAKRQQMQWTKRGAHLLLQIRRRALDGTLRPLFERWYPGLANDDATTVQAAAA
jgi:hypothetical protein